MAPLSFCRRRSGRVLARLAVGLTQHMRNAALRDVALEPALTVHHGQLGHVIGEHGRDRGSQIIVHMHNHRQRGCQMFTDQTATTADVIQPNLADRSLITVM